MANIEFINSLEWTELKIPLFYKSDYALRFDTTTEDLKIGELKYFDNAVERAITLFLDLFEDTKLFTVVIYSSGDSDEIDIETWSLAEETSACMNLSKAIVKSEIMPYVHDEEDLEILSVCTIIKIEKRDFDYYEMIKRICRQDLGRTPSIDDEIIILNDEMDIAYNFYDDRGVDVSAERGELLHDIYKQRKAWLYDYEDKDVKKL